jgi:hypothetical protein
VVICAAAALVSACISEGEEALPTAAEVEPLIHERGAAAQQYWTSAQAFERAPLGFKVRLEEAGGAFTPCNPGDGIDQGGSAGGERYQIFATWEPVGVPPAAQGGKLQQAVPVLERALHDAGRGPFQPSASSGLAVVATRHGLTLALDAHPADPVPLERDWIPAESYTVAGRCIPVTDTAATELRTVPGDSYGTMPTALPPIRIPTQ